jgi:glutamine amidotransferase-like uncharacterized protein
MVLRERSIAIYHDEGTGEFSRGCLTHALAGSGRVRRIYADEICASDAWHHRTLLLALPGGADRPYVDRLNGSGNASILRYLEAGGAFLGVCAGAYYTCSRIAFEANSPGAITAARELRLFAGTARGSLHDLAAPYALEHLRCAEVTRVFAPGADEALHVLYWGGPAFEPDPGTAFTPLLYYSDRSRLAAVRTRIGRGRAVLSGVHAEVSGAQLPIEVSRYAADSFEHGMQVSAELARVDGSRQRAFEVLLRALELDP